MLKKLQAIILGCVGCFAVQAQSKELAISNQSFVSGNYKLYNVDSGIGSRIELFRDASGALRFNLVAVLSSQGGHHGVVHRGLIILNNDGTEGIYEEGAEGCKLTFKSFSFDFTVEQSGRCESFGAYVDVSGWYGFENDSSIQVDDGDYKLADCSTPESIFYRGPIAQNVTVIARVKDEQLVGVFAKSDAHQKHIFKLTQTPIFKTLTAGADRNFSLLTPPRAPRSTHQIFPNGRDEGLSLLKVDVKYSDVSATGSVFVGFWDGIDTESNIEWKNCQIYNKGLLFQIK